MPDVRPILRVDRYACDHVILVPTLLLKGKVGLVECLLNISSHGYECPDCEQRIRGTRRENE